MKMIVAAITVIVKHKENSVAKTSTATTQERVAAAQYNKRENDFSD
jgi:hypothetical protein